MQKAKRRRDKGESGALRLARGEIPEFAPSALLAEGDEPDLAISSKANAREAARAESGIGIGGAPEGLAEKGKPTGLRDDFTEGLDGAVRESLVTEGREGECVLHGDKKANPTEKRRGRRRMVNRESKS